MTLPVAILAGGLATRLRPLTERVPKALIEVAGKSFISWQLSHLRDQGVQRVVLCTGYLGEMIEAEVGDGDDFNLEVLYSHDGPELLGTGGALRNALPLLGEAFFVMYGDSFLPIDFPHVEQAWLTSEKPSLMTVFYNQNQWDASNVLFFDGELMEYNKNKPNSEMKFIDYGLSVVSADSLREYSEKSPFDLADYYHESSIGGRLAGLEVFERFYEIGSHAGLHEAEVFLRGKNI